MTEKTAEAIISAIGQKAAEDCDASLKNTGEVDRAALRTLSQATRVHNQLLNAQENVRKALRTIENLSFMEEFDLPEGTDKKSLKN